MSRLMPGPVSLAALLAGVVSLAPTAYAAPAPAVRGVGISNIYPGTSDAAIDSELDAADRLGANTIRADISWARHEPRSAGRTDPVYRGRVDRLVVGANRRGIKPLLVVLRTPCWASSAEGAQERCTPSAESHPPSDPGQYARFVAYLAQRYRGRLAGIEIWNEPDHRDEAYFAGPDKPERYAAILRAAYAAINRVDPALPVLGGSLVGADGAFLRALYAAGIKGHYDGLAIHYYDLTLASIRSIREVQARNGDRRPLWLTEFGWTSCYPGKRTEGGHACVTPAHQARKLGDIFRALRGRSYVRAAVVYNLRDKANEHFGLLRTDRSAKPAFATLRTAFTKGLSRPSGLQARISRGRLRGSAPAGDVVQVQAFRGTRMIYRATLAPDRAGRFSLRLPGAVRGARVVVEQPWTRLRRTLRG